MSSYDRPGPLDGAIDRAVRDMMTVDPRPGLRHRVTHAIKTPHRRSYGFRVGLAAAGLVMAALVSVMLWSPSDHAGPVHAPQVAVTAPAAPVPPLAGPQAADAPVTGRPTPAAAPVRPQPRLTPTPESIFGPRHGRVAAASVPPARSAAAIEVFWREVPGHAARWSAVTPITFQPLIMVPLAVQPLFIGRQLPREGPRR